MIVESYLKDCAKLLGVDQKELKLFARNPGTPGLKEIPKDSPLLAPSIIKVNSVHYFLKNKSLIIYRFKVATLPGACGILVSFGAKTSHGYRNKGIHKRSSKFKQELAKKWGYGVVLCTDKKRSNPAQSKVLKKEKFKDVFKFVNPRSDNDITVSVKKVR